ncbi:MAG: NAD-dependent epimerase/dehydratase family protein [Planctomycetes bacterium]|nr:NAD-dependent epimerase/dehydratase family protein [Planctomycetota bacterium]
MSDEKVLGFWYGKRVLITGGDGFVASNLAASLMRKQATVVVSVRHQRPVSTLKLLGVGESPDIEHSDLHHSDAVQRICHRHRIDTIFHLAASAIVSSASSTPLPTLVNNILPTANILETARVLSIPRVVVASSDKAYGDHTDSDDPERIPYREGHALRGMDVYSASKVCADMICQTYALQFGLPVAVVRPCNIYGPGDLNFTRLVPRTVLRVLRGNPPVINQGNEDVLREYTHVEDVVRAYELIAEKLPEHCRSGRPRSGRATYGWAAFNVGSYAPHGSFHPEREPNIRSVRQVISLITTQLGRPDLAA